MWTEEETITIVEILVIWQDIVEVRELQSREEELNMRTIILLETEGKSSSP